MSILFIMRKSLYISLGLFDRLLGRKNNLFVLCYHSVNSDGWRYGVSLSELKKHINHLADNYQFITSDDLYLFISGKKTLDKPSVLITFDDGYKDILSTASYFKEKNIKPIVFVVASPTLVDRSQLQTDRDLLTQNDITLLQKKGWTIGNHSMTHADFNTLITNKQLTEEVITSKKILERNSRTQVNYFAYPKGVYNGVILSAIQKASYRLAFSMDDGLISSRTHKFIIPRVGVDRSHSFTEFKYLTSPSVLIVRKLLKKIVGGLI